MPSIKGELEALLGKSGTFTVDCCASDHNHICPAYYTQSNSFLDATIGTQPSGKPHVLWCNPPFQTAEQALPFVTHLMAQVKAHPGAIGVVLFPDWENTAVYKLLQTQEVLKRYPAGSRLFSMPAVEDPTQRRAMRGTPWPVTVYVVGRKTPTSLQESQAEGKPHPYTFSGSILGTKVRARTGKEFHVLSAEQAAQVEAATGDSDALRILADTGATHCLIPHRLTRQLGIPLIQGSEGRRVILGDNSSAIPVLGTCEFPLKLGKSTTTVQALVIDVEWGSLQHLVLGADWIERHNVLIGVSHNKGPQMHIGGRDGKAGHVVYARKPRHASFSQHTAEGDSYTPVSAAKFAAMLATPHADDEDGSPWIAVDVTRDGVAIGNAPRIPLAVFAKMSLDAVNAVSGAAAANAARFSEAHVRYVPRTEAAPEGEAAPPRTHTPAGVPIEQINAYVRDFPTVFQKDLPDRRPTDERPAVPETVHTIPLLPNAKPVYRKQWRLSPREYEEIMKHVKYLLEKGLIEPSSSPWSAPILFTPKPDGTLRLCIDYRGLNALTERDVYPLPKGEEMYSRVKGKKIFSTLDLLKGYNQIWIQEEDRHLTAFTTPRGLFQWKVLAMGLTNAPATFQRYMVKVFADLIEDGHVMVYLDDILVMANTVEEHDRIMREVLARLAREGLVVRFDKCKFGETHVKFLGAIISGETVTPDPKKVQAVRDWPIPDTRTALRGFLGLSNYFRRFIKGYAALCAPLHARSSGKKESIELTPEEISAFEAVKAALVNAPILSIEDPKLPYEVWTDASTTGIGAVLLQREPDGTPRVIAYESKRLGRKRASVVAHLDPAVQVPLQEGCIGLDQASLEDASGKQELAAVLHALKVWRCC